MICATADGLWHREFQNHDQLEDPGNEKALFVCLVRSSYSLVPMIAEAPDEEHQFLRECALKNATAQVRGVMYYSVEQHARVSGRIEVDRRCTASELLNSCGDVAMYDMMDGIATPVSEPMHVIMARWMADDCSAPEVVRTSLGLGLNLIHGWTCLHCVPLTARRPQESSLIVRGEPPLKK